mmetsp:Transcript_30747/g.59327  ORF Transcript_30747/g.59327 Transcript_30747/m.59327 type:complete len:198 (+) Transcript_30747:103-696(+)|eukprot:CAMPEP_0114262340 /NCGR_PEP_ID=MMETSP0058-20121206/21745_1 /TAXON_ID=36894 /ORGANISM="Pyramimonas parkeae, CCMP726" /LENGTH=197 /DNA_ID=CAMNT_0001378189 /DNA_START=221 /DNA_END=814 /DNA_ORIENTATION=+
MREHLTNSRQIRELTRDTPVFVKIPNTTGTVALWHFPSKAQLEIAHKQGCNTVVTLQSEDENILSVQRTCDVLGMQWINLDFWKYFLPQHKNQDILDLADKLIVQLNQGANILIHCAAGVHRTGTLSYIILRRLGLNRKESYEYLGTLRPVTRQAVGDQRIEKAEQQFRKWFQYDTAPASSPNSSCLIPRTEPMFSL